MAESLIFKLLSSGLLCIFVLLPLYYLLGYGTWGLVNSIWHARFNESYRFKFEDVLVAAIATLSIIIIGCKVAGVFPHVQLIFKLSAAVSIVCLLLSLAYSRFSAIKYRLPLPNGKHTLVWLGLFSIYLIRATIKARSLSDAQYIPSRFNTDVFLYIRRSIVFLGEAAQVQSENNQTMLEILYDSPKLLSTFIYATFTYIINDIGIAGTIIISLVLATIVFKYLLLIKAESNFPDKISTIALVILIIFQPVWCWLHDQFYWSNLLCIYLLIYTLEDLLISNKISRIYLVKLAIALVALAGFYPSQLPFFMMAVVFGIIFQPSLTPKSRYQYLLVIVIITIAIMTLFFTQYINTTEVVKHFDISDAEHGQNLNYIPFWSFFDFIPKTGGTPKDIGAMLLITASLITGFFMIKKCIKVVPDQSNWFKLLIGLYTVYSLSYLLLPGEYRQSKFFFTYIVPLIVFCSIKAVLQSKLQNHQVFKILFSALAIYVAVKSLLKPYKPHVSSKVSSAIATIQSLNQPTLIYMDDGSIAHGYYYFAYQIRNLDFQLISGCPQATNITSIDSNANTLVIAASCPEIDLDPELKAKIIYPDINGKEDN